MVVRIFISFVLAALLAGCGGAVDQIKETADRSVGPDYKVLKEEA